MERQAQIVGGGLGDRQLDAAGVKALATLPSLDQLRAKFLGLLQTPAGRIAGVLQAPGGAGRPRARCLREEARAKAA